MRKSRSPPARQTPRAAARPVTCREYRGAPGTVDTRHRYDPTGTTLTTVVYREGIQVGYRCEDANNATPLFPFGYGLSYTNFRYSGLTVTGSASGLDVSFAVTNSGEVAGSGSPQMYLGAPASIAAGAQLAKSGHVAFSPVSLKPGQNKRVTAHITQRQLSH